MNCIILLFHLFREAGEYVQAMRGMVTEPRQPSRGWGVGAVLAEAGDWKTENKCEWSLGV